MAVYDHVTKSNRRWYKEGEEVDETYDSNAYADSKASGSVDLSEIRQTVIEVETT